MLDEILAARTVMQHGHLEFARHVKLMKPGENDFRDLLLFVAAGNEVTA